MSKLFKLKKFLTLNATADYLSAVFEEEVTVVDVLQLAIEKHITLSVNLINHAQARIGKAVPAEQAKIRILIHYPCGLSYARSHGYPSPILEDDKIPEDVKLVAHQALREQKLNAEQEQVFEDFAYQYVQYAEGTTLHLDYQGERIPEKNLVIELNEPMSVFSIDGIWDGNPPEN